MAPRCILTAKVSGRVCGRSRTTTTGLNLILIAHKSPVTSLTGSTQIGRVQRGKRPVPGKGSDPFKFNAPKRGTVRENVTGMPTPASEKTSCPTGFLAGRYRKWSYQFQLTAC
ncbi:hypothetical protein ZHAS_00017902 [Anopheles sinensis]|uniref:Uncharacterized protein n=1 Tax=Anopheles sinensis TaxID=74873 RepID=A0A084WI32_ANOSI|nr:hypothetical protein ZHAS_00017902 [Anopheles sinensis]